MWSNTGSQANQYIELRNLSSSSVDLTWWQLKNAWAPIILNWSIPGNWLYLISKNDANSSILSPSSSPNLLAWSLVISTWSILVLSDDLDVDYDAAIISWNKWDNNIPRSMERLSFPWDWTIDTNWSNAVWSVNFDNTNFKWTPNSANIYDVTSPTITSFSPLNNTLYPIWNNISLNFQYSDSGWINDSNYNFKLEKNDWAWNYIDVSWIWLTNSWVDANSWSFNYSNISFWQYKMTFNISDTNGNTANVSSIFYVDKMEMIISSWAVDIGNLNPNSVLPNMSENLTITVKTLWAWFSLNLWWSWTLNAWLSEIWMWNWTNWFWFDCTSWWEATCNNDFTWINDTIIQNYSTWNIDTNWNQKIFIYNIRYWAKITSIQEAWIYAANSKFNIILNY
ncbi:MAG: hypothetical protein ACD_4C00278G0001 [uncultured bacterium (gcode 4)]|uniref:LTD domain-containing protein n=1 Tax=uncultured bacterium (gcode 4) TaxID=1234023 RepID=K2FX66_9BACT|nr:MAG: hypothetical protein ACD_4C00278G0001 [uncultured bacterium (gcode 4)]